MSLVTDAQELVELRAREATVASGQRPTQDLVTQVTGVLAEVGLPSERLKDLVQQSDSALPSSSDGGPKSPACRRQVVRFTIEPFTTRELGAFLSAWHSARQVWTVTQIELSHVGREEDAAFSAVLQIAAVYVAEPVGEELSGIVRIQEGR